MSTYIHNDNLNIAIYMFRDLSLLIHNDVWTYIHVYAVVVRTYNIIYVIMCTNYLLISREKINVNHNKYVTYQLQVLERGQLSLR